MTLRPDIDRIIGHRGASAVAPENTLAAFRACAAQGARWIEFDVTLLGDGTPVVIHDDVLDRCSSARGPVRGLKAADLADIDAGSWFSPAFAGERIPTLAQALQCMAELGLNGNLEIKTCPDGLTSAGFVAPILAELRDLPAGLRMVISSFDRAVLAAVRRQAPQRECAILWENLPPDWRVTVRELSAHAVHLDYRGLNADILRRVKEAGCAFRVWTCDDPAAIAAYWAQGLDAVITNDPRLYLPGVEPGIDG